jgi:hypothetical protein
MFAVHVLIVISLAGLTLWDLFTVQNSAGRARREFLVKSAINVILGAAWTATVTSWI